MVQTGFAGLKTWFKALVIASLALNLLIVGFVTSFWFRHGGKHHGHAFAIERSLMHFARRDLPHDRKRALRKAWREERKAFRPMFRELRDGRKQVGEVLERMPYDRAALQATLDRFVEKRTAAQAKITDVFLRMIETLTDEEKRAFGTFLKTQKPGRRWRRHHRGE